MSVASSANFCDSLLECGQVITAIEGAGSFSMSRHRRSSRYLVPIFIVGLFATAGLGVDTSPAIAAIPAISLNLAGANGAVPATSSMGNGYSATLDVPSGDPAPTGDVTVTDTATSPGSCGTNTWVNAGSDGSSGENYTATCSITTAETGGETVSAAYDQSDYNVSASNILTIKVVDTVTFDSEGGSAVTSISGPDGSSITLPAAPTRAR